MLKEEGALAPPMSDILELLKNIPGYQKRKNSKQIPVKYGLFIYSQQTEELTKGTKRRKAITSKKYTKQNSKSYKNLTWLNRMYDRKMKEIAHLDPKDVDPLYKVIIPLEFPQGYKLYDLNGEYYATVLDSDDIFLYLAIGKRTDDVFYFLRSKMESLYIKGQCEKKYGLSVPLEFVKNYERPD